MLLSSYLFAILFSINRNIITKIPPVGNCDTAIIWKRNNPSGNGRDPLCFRGFSLHVRQDRAVHAVGIAADLRTVGFDEIAEVFFRKIIGVKAV